MNKHAAPSTGMVMLRRATSPPVRRWLYGVCLALVPVAVIYGILTDEEAAVWLGLAGALLSSATAITHVQDERQAYDDAD